MKAKELLSEYAEDTRSDIEEIKLTFEKDRVEGGNTLFYKLKKYRMIIFAVFAIGFLVVMSENVKFSIPTELSLFVLTTLVGSVVAYPYANKIAKLFIKDSRIPLVVVDPENLNDIEIWYIPQSRMRDIEVDNGELNDINTAKGKGLECKTFNVKEVEGQKKLVAQGTWLGSKSGLELKRKESEIQAMYDTLEPLAKMGISQKVKWPQIMYDLSEKIINSLVHDFQGIANYKGQEMQGHINDIINEYEPEEPNDNSSDVSDLAQEIANATNGETNGNDNLEVNLEQ